VPKYDANGFTCITWGTLKTMTVAFWNAYVDESPRPAEPGLAGSQGAPSGFNLAELQADLDMIH